MRGVIISLVHYARRFALATRAENVEPKIRCDMMKAETERAVYFENVCDIVRESCACLLIVCSTDSQYQDSIHELILLPYSRRSRTHQ
jgi:hypothetical protein